MLINPMTLSQTMKVTPIPLLNTSCDQESPLSVVSDSFGHENGVDISKSSEERTSATGSKVAPRSIGSLFSPTKREQNRQRKRFIPLKEGNNTKWQNYLSSSLRSKKCGFLVEWADMEGWKCGNEWSDKKHEAPRWIEYNIILNDNVVKCLGTLLVFFFSDLHTCDNCRIVIVSCPETVAPGLLDPEDQH